MNKYAQREAQTAITNDNRGGVTILGILVTLFIVHYQLSERSTEAGYVQEAWLRFRVVKLPKVFFFCKKEENKHFKTLYGTVNAKEKE